MDVKKTKFDLYKYSLTFICICGVLIFAISNMIYFYSDDMYYASFSKNGYNHFIKMNIAHYKNINGRAMVHILDEALLMFGKKLFAVINPIMILGFAFLASKCLNFKDTINSAKENTYISTAITLFFIMCLPKQMINETVYWITGSMNYIFPALLLVIMYYMLRANIKISNSTIKLFVFSFLSGATTEQGGFVAVVMSTLLVLSTLVYRDSPKQKLYVLSPIFAIMGLLTVILAPGTFARIESIGVDGFSQTTLYNRLLENTSHISFAITGENGIQSILIILVLAILFTTYKAQGINRLFLAGPAIMSLLLYQRVSGVYSKDLCTTITILSAAYITLWGLSILKYAKYRHLGIFIVGAVSLQCLMLISPILGSRTLLITGLLLAASIGGLSSDLIKNPLYITLSASILAFMLLPIKSGTLLIIVSLGIYLIKKTSKLQTLVVFTTFILFFTPILKGYYTNHIIMKNNEKNIVKAHSSGKLYWNIDLVTPYYHDMFYENLNFEPYFLENNNLPKDTHIYLVSKIHKPVFLNGQRLKCPSIKRDIRYYPLRDIFEGAGGKVYWDNKTNGITVVIKNTEYVFIDLYSINKLEKGRTDTIFLERKIETYLGRTYIPESFVSSFLEITEKNGKILLSLK
ncbi:DUF6056 family protein [Petroclostridium sp. X23]|uniref:DUF6056 family protein n=1 Tax=Petroclostridium sp. X23 TaxID=3045146 RepID=UPI0024AE76FA|nr:DUF6056 family protein [Petroclostridium sp. X23]WHH60463.1 DUF6056 family protein [Petroclostridium sp. X23]